MSPEDTIERDHVVYVLTKESKRLAETMNQECLALLRSQQMQSTAFTTILARLRTHLSMLAIVLERGDTSGCQKTMHAIEVLLPELVAYTAAGHAPAVSADTNWNGIERHIRKLLETARECTTQHSIS